MKDLKGLIFDLDGVIADTEDLHRRAYNLVFREVGIDVEWSEQDYRDRLIQTAGSKLSDLTPIVSHPDPAAFQRDLYTRKREVYLDLLTSAKLPPRPGVIELIDSARTAGVKIGAASTCAKEGALALLNRTLGEERVSFFSTIKAGEDAKNRKPAPDIYLIALEGLGLRAENCVAIEDSVHGMRSALAAGLHTVVTPSQYTKGDDFSGASWIVEDAAVNGLTLNRLARLLENPIEELV